MMFENMIRVLERVGTAVLRFRPSRRSGRPRSSGKPSPGDSSERSRGPRALARFAWRRVCAARDRLLPGRDWLDEPPAEVAAAFPDLAAAYGRPASSAS